MAEIWQTGQTYGSARKILNTIFSGTANFSTVVSTINYATTLSGNTIYSGASDLSYIFAPISTITLTSVFSGNPINGAIMPYSGSNIASGAFSFVAGGKSNKASGSYSIAQGFQTSATTTNSHSEGYKTFASGLSSHSEGNNAIASGNFSHAEGKSSIASGAQSHAEGSQTSATTSSSHAEGDKTTASGTASHSEGYLTTASGSYSHAGGSGSTTSGQASFIHSSNSSLVANNSSILGGFLNRLNTAATGSTILGGSNITGSTADMVYVPNLTATTSIYAQNFYSGSTNLNDVFTSLSAITKIIDIGDWNMDSTASINVAHGIGDWTKIRTIQASIINDVSGAVFNLINSESITGVEIDNTSIAWNSTNIVLRRVSNGIFDSTGFDATSFNRGWVIILYLA